MLSTLKRIIAVALITPLLGVNLLIPQLVDAVSVPVNLIANPSVETADPANSSAPQGWLQGNWGTNKATFTYPAVGEDGSHSVEVQLSSYTSGDAKWYFNPVAVTASSVYTYSDYYQSTVASDIVVQFDDGSGNYKYSDLGTQAASATWKQFSANITVPAGEKNLTVFHLISSVGTLQTDNFSLSSNVVPSGPSVNITAPTASSTVSGLTNLAATASDSSGIAGVQFKVDGNNIGAEVTTAPYQTSWDTTSWSNGSHAVTAVARNSANATTTSTAVQVNVNNSVSLPAGSNLISNPSFETADPTNAQMPLNWLEGGWGTNTTAFSYITNAGHTGTHSAKVQMSAYTNGDAKWYFAPVTVTPGAVYNFSDYYQSNISSDVMAQFDNGSGSYTYQDLGTQAASAAWKQATASFTAPATAKQVTIFHLISATGTLQIDDSSLAVSTAPTITITAPVVGTSVNGTVMLTANASASIGITNVQFKIDGVNQGSAVTTSPYQLTWDTTKVADGSHIITAVMTTSDNKTTTSAPITVNVSNQIAGAGGNLIPNPSLETVNASNSKLPQDWTNGSWGTNKTTFTYLTTGHSGTHSVKTQISSYSSGASYWFSTSVPVTGGQMYDYSDYYESNITSEIDAGITMSDGSEQDMYLGDAFQSPNSWTKFETQFTLPAGAVAVTFYHNIYSVGWVTTDDYSLTPFTYQGFNRPIVSLTFDDGYESFYNYGLPLLQKYGFKSTDYIISGYMNADPSYMTSAQVKQLYSTGQEIGSHTVDHADLATLSVTKLDGELKNSQITLQNLLGVPVKNMATPYGSANDQVITDAKKYYTTVRGVQAGYNSKNNFSPYNIRVQNMEVTTTLAQVQAWVQQAEATNTWLVLVYHQVDPTLTDKVAQPYNTYPSDLDAQLSYIKSTGVAVETVNQAMAELTPQLSN